MRAIYKKDGNILKFDYGCSLVPQAGDEVVINSSSYQVVGRRLDLDDKKVIVYLKQ